MYNIDMDVVKRAFVITIVAGVRRLEDTPAHLYDEVKEMVFEEYEYQGIENPYLDKEEDEKETPKKK